MVLRACMRAYSSIIKGLCGASTLPTQNYESVACRRYHTIQLLELSRLCPHKRGGARARSPSPSGRALTWVTKTKHHIMLPPLSSDHRIFTCYQDRFCLVVSIHAIWFKWDRLCGTISKFLAFMWDIWYQFCQMDGTVLGVAWWSGSVDWKKIVWTLLCSWIVLSNNWFE